MSRMSPRVLLSIAALLVAACGQQQQQGFHGFPPAHVTLQKVEPRALRSAAALIAPSKRRAPTHCHAGSAWWGVG